MYADERETRGGGEMRGDYPVEFVVTICPARGEFCVEVLAVSAQHTDKVAHCVGGKLKGSTTKSLEQAVQVAQVLFNNYNGKRVATVDLDPQLWERMDDLFQHAVREGEPSAAQVTEQPRHQVGAHFMVDGTDTIN